MPLFPTSDTYRPVNPVLQGIVQGLGNADGVLIGRDVLPAIFNGSGIAEGEESYATGQIMRLGVDAMFGNPDADHARSPGAEYREHQGASLDSVEYACKQWAGQAFIPGEVSARAQLGGVTTMQEIQLGAAMAALRIEEEKRISAIFSTLANWGTTTTLAGADQWNEATSDPSKDILTAVNTIVPYGAPWGGLTAIFGLTAFNTLVRNSAWNEFRPLASDRTLMSEDDIAAVLASKYGISKTYVGRAHYNTSAAPGTLTLSPIWDDFVWIGALGESSQAIGQGDVMVGMTAAARVVEADYDVREWFDPARNRTVYPFAYSQWEGVVRDVLGYVINDCTA